MGGSDSAKSFIRVKYKYVPLFVIQNVLGVGERIDREG